jgi:hypothetical protein
MNALEFVQGAPSIHPIVVEINEGNRYKAEDLAAAYAVDSLTIEEMEFLDESLQRHLDDLLFRQANFDEQKAMDICRKIVNS